MSEKDLKIVAKDNLVKNFVENKINNQEDIHEPQKADTEATESVENTAFIITDTAYQKGKAYAEKKYSIQNTNNKQQNYKINNIKSKSNYVNGSIKTKEQYISKNNDIHSEVLSEFNNIDSKNVGNKNSRLEYVKNKIIKNKKMKNKKYNNTMHQKKSQ